MPVMRGHHGRCGEDYSEHGRLDLPVNDGGADMLTQPKRPRPSSASH
jgi:hypothetical protein